MMTARRRNAVVLENRFVQALVVGPHLVWLWLAFCLLLRWHGLGVTALIVICVVLALIIVGGDLRQAWKRHSALRNCGWMLLLVGNPFFLSVLLSLGTLALSLLGSAALTVGKGEMLTFQETVNNRTCLIVVSGKLSQRAQFELEVAQLERSLRDLAPDVYVTGYYVPTRGLVRDFLVGWPEWCLSLCSLRSPLTQELSNHLGAYIYDYRVRNNRVCCVGHSHGNQLIANALSDLAGSAPEILPGVAVIALSNYTPRKMFPSSVQPTVVNNSHDPVASFPWNFHNMWRGWNFHRLLTYVDTHLGEIDSALAKFESRNY